MLKKVFFILNPIAGLNRRPARIAQWIHEFWSDTEIEYEIAKTGHRGHGTELALKAVEAKFDMVVAAGGDGTINEVGQGLIGSKTGLGIIPAGSGNGFARNLNIPMNQRAAIKMLRQPRFTHIDVGKINDYYFFNIAGAGIDAIVSERFNRFKIRGIVPYIMLTIREFFRFKPVPVSIKLAGQEITRSPLLLSVANLPEFGNNTIIAPDARGDDGLLDVCIVNPISKLRAFFNIPKLFNGTLKNLPEMEIYQTRKLTLTRQDGGLIHTDGNPHHAASVLSIEVLPRKLKVAIKG